MYYVLRDYENDTVMILDRETKKKRKIPYFAVERLMNIEDGEKYMTVYNTELNKKELLNFKEFTKKVNQGEVFGYAKGKRYNDYIDAYFKIGLYIYYIYQNVILVYSIKKQELIIYDTMGESTFCEICFSGRIVKLYRVYDNKIEIIKMIEKNLVRKITISKEEFNNTYKRIALKYLMSKA